MSKINLTIVYYSATGTNYQMALAAKEAAEAAGAEVRLRKVRELAPDATIDAKPAWRAHIEATQHVDEVTLDDLAWADAYIFGTPTRFGNIAAQLKQFLDTTGGLWFKGALSNKVVAGFTSAQNAHGGQETTLMALYNTFYHWGSIIVPPGYTDPVIFGAGGNPYGVSATADGEPVPDAVLEAARYMTRRVVDVAQQLARGRAED